MRTKSSLLARLDRLESRTISAERRIKIRMGNLKWLPREYDGERHIIMTGPVTDGEGRESFEYEEVPGPDPNPHQPRRSGPQYIDVMFVDCPNTERPA